MTAESPYERRSRHELPISCTTGYGSAATLWISIRDVAFVSGPYSAQTASSGTYTKAEVGRQSLAQGRKNTPYYEDGFKTVWVLS
jgi:hypothetical protein